MDFDSVESTFVPIQINVDSKGFLKRLFCQVTYFCLDVIPEHSQLACPSRSWMWIKVSRWAEHGLFLFI